ncbi:MAG: cytochrome c [Parvularculaceae bacterium]|nr:cytochrome c [Caulobacterales bacterium]
MKKVLLISILALSLTSCGSRKEAADDQAKETLAPQASAGKQVFDKWCAYCHGKGERFPGTVSLAVKYGEDLPAALEEREDLTPETVSLFVRQGVYSMPPFRKTEITDEELAALGAYLSHTENLADDAEGVVPPELQ